MTSARPGPAARHARPGARRLLPVGALAVVLVAGAAAALGPVQGDARAAMVTAGGVTLSVTTTTRTPSVGSPVGLGVGVTSDAARKVTVALTVLRADGTTAFSWSRKGRNLAPGTTRSWTASFTPAAAGTFTTRATVTDDATKAVLVSDPASAVLTVGTPATGTPTATTPAATPSTTAPAAGTPTSSAPSTAPSTTPASGGAGRWSERLDRGAVAVRSGAGYLVSWRLLASDPAGVGFTVYRDGTRLTATPVTTSTNYLDATAPVGARYTVRAVVGGVEQAAASAVPFTDGSITVPLRRPAGGTTPDGVAYTYSPNDASPADLDGDGDLDLVLKWDPSNSKDNSQSGYTGNVYLDGVTLQGALLWRIDLGRNVRAGAHYTQFQVYDYDGNGRAEVAVRTSDGTKDGTGAVLGSATADHRSSNGYVLTGPESLTVFDGKDGRALASAPYVPARGSVSAWGDGYGNRVDRFLAGTAYLDGVRPSMVFSRGYYTRTVVAAWDYRDGKLTRRWTFDSDVSGSAYRGQGNHAFTVADVDADGRDEIVFGAMAIDDTGKPLWNTGLGHGDAEHVGDLDPSRPGLEVFKVDEDASKPSAWFADARTGKVLWQRPAAGDNGRGVSGDVWAGSPGAESWSALDTDLRSTTGAAIGRKPSSQNFLVWWDGDPVRELLDRTYVNKYTPTGDTRLLTGAGVTSNNGTKATPSLSGDLLGDWREEVVWATTDASALKIYSTPIRTDRRLVTLLQDSQYRTALAGQNTGYNQPPHPGFFLGDGMRTPPTPVLTYP